MTDLEKQTQEKVQEVLSHVKFILDAGPLTQQIEKILKNNHPILSPELQHLKFERLDDSNPFGWRIMFTETFMNQHGGE
jgi:hypothetical protein